MQGCRGRHWTRPILEQVLWDSGVSAKHQLTRTKTLTINQSILTVGCLHDTRFRLRLHLIQNLLQNQFKQVTMFLDLSQLIVSFSSYGKNSRSRLLQHCHERVSRIGTTRIHQHFHWWPCTKQPAIHVCLTEHFWRLHLIKRNHDLIAWCIVNYIQTFDSLVGLPSNKALP